MNERQPLDLRAVGLVIMLCVIWAFQQIAIKGTDDGISPVMQLAIRFSGATLFFGVWVSLREGRAAFADGTVPSGLLLGLLFALEFVFASQALRHTTAGHTIVFLYTATIFTALGLQFLPEEHLTRVQWAGVILSFVGIGVAFLGAGNRSAHDLVIGDAYALLGGLCWGLSNVVLRRGKVGGATAVKTVLYQVAVAVPLLGGFAVLSDQVHVELTTITILGLLFQTFIVAICSYLLWFWLLRRYLTSRLMLLSLLTPLFGVGFGAALLHEVVDSRFVLGALLVLAGVLVVNLQFLLKR
jgi:drug/metabolite transporter (DMT)-like permease